jgi:hypothetical protein
MSDYPTTGSTSVDVAATAADAWALVSDVTRIGEFSPECRRAEWTVGESIAVGNRFRGFNQNGDYHWDVECEIVDAVDESSFTYVVPPGFEHGTRWSFAVETHGERCRITQSFEAPMLGLPDVYPSEIDGRCAGLQAAIEKTLGRIKVALES